MIYKLQKHKQVLHTTNSALIKELEYTKIELQKVEFQPVATYMPTLTSNPGNIVKGNKWIGEVHCKGRFECFRAPEYGVRAMAIIIKNYKKKYGLTTVEQIIHRWAPPHENNTQEFIRFVRKRVGSDYTLEQLIDAIIIFEQGRQMPLRIIQRGISIS